MVAGLKELLPNVPSLDLAMRVLQSRIQRWRKGVGDSLLWSTSPTQWGGWSRRQVIILNDQKASPPLLPRHGWSLPTWCGCWRFKWRNSAGGGMLSPLLSVLTFPSPGTWWRRRHCSCEQDRRREVDRGRARRRAHSCHGYHYWRYETWPGWKVKSVGYRCMRLFLNISLRYRETPVTDEEKAGAAWALVPQSEEVMWHSGPPMWCISCP